MCDNVYKLYILNKILQKYVYQINQVKGELEQIEKEAAYDYLKVEKEMFELDDEISKSDNILEQLEKVLLNFRDHLNEIKSEMT